MPRKTRYMVYVDAKVMKDPQALFDAVITHFIKKGMDIALRRQFISAYIKANNRGAGIALIDEWVQVRDAAAFPFAQQGETTDLTDPATATEFNGACKRILEDGLDEDTATEGGVSVDEEGSADGVASE